MLFNIVYNVYVCLDYQSNIYLFILGFEAFSSVVILFLLYTGLERCLLIDRYSNANKLTERCARLKKGANLRKLEIPHFSYDVIPIKVGSQEKLDF